MLVEIEDQKDLYRDTETRGLMSTANQYEEHRKRVDGKKRINSVIDDVQFLKEELMSKKHINSIIDDVQYLKEEMSEIKQLLKDIKNGS